MSDQSNLTAVLDKITTQSSLYEKLTRDQRRQLDQAIIDHDPPTYRALFEKFALASFGVSFTAFYYYARRLRANATLLEIARMALPEGAELDKVLPRLLGHRLFDACLKEETSPNTLYRLAHTYRIASELHMTRRRLEASLEEAQRQVPDQGRERERPAESPLVRESRLPLTASWPNEAVKGPRVRMADR